MILPNLVIPSPRQAQEKPGVYVVSDSLKVFAPGDSAIALRPFLRQLEDACGVQTVLVTAIDQAQLRVTLENTDSEEYSLTVSNDGIDVSGGIAGVRWAAQTLRSLLPVASLMPGSGVEPELAYVEILDGPALPWRGVMIDVARHFFPAVWLRRLIELAVFHKLNVVHIHLTDDQGWRMPIDAFPRLTDVGGIRRETLVGSAPADTYDGIPHGGWYTKDELRALVAYARDLGVTVVPEIDLPGHMVAAIAAYPQWGNNSEVPEVLTTWGISKTIINARQETINALKTVLDEVMDVFDSPYIHIGGDEVPTDEWEASEEIAEIMAENDLDSPRALQGWIMGQLIDHVRSAGRQVLGWDEIVDAGVDTETVVVAWRSPEHVMSALEGGYPTIAAPQQHYYLDYQHSLDPAEPLGIGAKYDVSVNMEKVLEYQPPEGVLGVQGQLWTEYVDTSRRAEFQIFPRLAAIAEVAWSGRTPTLSEFEPALEAQMRRYNSMGVEYHPQDGPGPKWTRTFGQ